MTTMDLEDGQIVEVRTSAPPPLPRSRDAISDAITRVLSTKGGPWQVAGRAAKEIVRILRARTVLVHLYDARRGEVRVIGADGRCGQDFLGTVEPADEDFVASTLLANGKSLTISFDGEIPRVAPERLHTMGAKRSLAAVPMRTKAGFVGMIEIVDAEEHVGRVAEDVARIAERIAPLLS